MREEHQDQQYIIQLTGGDLLPGQKSFPKRSPADPVAFIDEVTREAFIYGTQVDGSGITFLRYSNVNALLQGGAFDLRSHPVYLPDGKILAGKEAIWDTFRLAFRHLKAAFPTIDASYAKHGIK